MDLIYKDTKAFFEERAEKYNDANPYGATMYQDNNSELVKNRNEMEKQRILPLLRIDPQSVVLDIACGVGRWADILGDSQMKQYYGTDFSSKMIGIARERVQQPNCSFYIADTGEIKEVFKNPGWDKSGSEKYACNRILLAGILCYLNDQDIGKLFDDLNDICAADTRIYIRVPVGIEERLTLKDFYSDELKTEYNAIYRTRNEYYKIMEGTLIKNGFHIEEEGYLYEDDSLNNRVETRQYFFIISREKGE